MATDKDNIYPLPSMLTAVSTLEGNDIAEFDTMLEPYDRHMWAKEAKEAHELIEKGYVPDASLLHKFLGNKCGIRYGKSVRILPSWTLNGTQRLKPPVKNQRGRGREKGGWPNQENKGAEIVRDFFFLSYNKQSLVYMQ